MAPRIGSFSRFRAREHGTKSWMELPSDSIGSLSDPTDAMGGGHVSLTATLERRGESVILGGVEPLLGDP